MGKGDKKTKRGKIIQGSYGVTRRRKPEAKAATLLSDKPVKEKVIKEVVADEVVKEAKKTAPKTTKKKEEPTAE